MVPPARYKVLIRQLERLFQQFQEGLWNAIVIQEPAGVCAASSLKTLLYLLTQVACELVVYMQMSVSRQLYRVCTRYVVPGEYIRQAEFYHVIQEYYIIISPVPRQLDESRELIRWYLYHRVLMPYS